MEYDLLWAWRSACNLSIVFPLHSWFFHWLCRKGDVSISQYPYHFSETKRCLFRAIDDHVRVKTKRCSFQESKYFINFFVCSYFFRGMVRHNGSVLIKLRLLNFDAIFGICTFWHGDGMMDRWCHCRQLKPKTKHGCHCILLQFTENVGCFKWEMVCGGYGLIWTICHVSCIEYFTHVTIVYLCLALAGYAVSCLCEPSQPTFLFRSEHGELATNASYILPIHEPGKYFDNLRLQYICISL